MAINRDDYEDITDQVKAFEIGGGSTTPNRTQDLTAQVNPQQYGQAPVPQYQKKNKFLEETPEYADERAINVAGKKKEIETQFKTRADAISAGIKDEKAFNQITDASNLLSDSLRNSMIQNKGILKTNGVELDPTRGLSGLAFGKVMTVLNSLGYNDYFDSVANGLSTELAIEIGKQLGQGAGMRMGEKMIEILKGTLPSMKGDATLASNLNQITNTMLNSYRKIIVSGVDDNGESFYKTPDERREAGIEFEGEFRDRLFSKFERAGLYKSEMITMTDPNGVDHDVKDYMMPYFLNKNYTIEE